MLVGRAWISTHGLLERLADLGIVVVRRARLTAYIRRVSGDQSATSSRAWSTKATSIGSSPVPSRS